MYSPPAEMVLDVVHFAGRNLLRNQGEADNDTWSEIIRALKNRLPGSPRAQNVQFAGALGGAAALFWVHICR